MSVKLRDNLSRIFSFYGTEVFLKKQPEINDLMVNAKSVRFSCYNPFLYDDIRLVGILDLDESLIIKLAALFSFSNHSKHKPKKYFVAFDKGLLESHELMPDIVAELNNLGLGNGEVNEEALKILSYYDHYSSGLPFNKLAGAIVEYCYANNVIADLRPYLPIAGTKFLAREGINLSRDNESFLKEVLSNLDQRLSLGQYFIDECLDFWKANEETLNPLIKSRIGAIIYYLSKEDDINKRLTKRGLAEALGITDASIHYQLKNNVSGLKRP